MGKSYFQFKQFRIDQDECAMKVCTDSCIFGASIDVDNPNRILDIGAGTGLLSLMLAQKYSCHIDAVEIESKAGEQAKANFEKSKWPERLHLYISSIQLFEDVSMFRYDLILCNPPFFSKHLKSPDLSRNLAIHDEQLSLSHLLKATDKLISEKGHLYILLPEYESKQFETMAVQFSLFPQKRIKVLNKEGKQIFRVITSFSKKEKNMEDSYFVIKNETGDYTSQFKELLKDYYLHLQ